MRSLAFILSFLVAGLTATLTQLDIAKYLHGGQTCILIASGIALCAPSVKLHRLTLGLSVCCGLLWGFAHNAPSCTHAGKIRTLAQDQLVFGGGLILVQSSDESQHVCKAFGRLHKYETGRLQCVREDKVGESFCFVSASRNDASVREERAFKRIAHTIYLWVKGRIALLPESQRPWLSLLILGEKNAFSKELLSDFKRAGLYHLLIISGLHIALLSKWVELLCSLPLRSLYAAKFISPIVWIFGSQLIRMSAAALVFLFTLAIGAPVATQRASLIHVVQVFLSNFCHAKSYWVWMVVAATLQILIFPVGFLSAGNVMSWIGYVGLVAGITRSSNGLASYWLNSVVLQVIFFVLTFVLFSQWSPLGLILNFLLVDAFSFLVLLGFAVLFFAKVLPILTEVQTFLTNEYMRFVEILVERYPWDLALYEVSKNYHAEVRLSFLLLLLVCLSYRLTSIRPINPSEKVS